MVCCKYCGRFCKDEFCSEECNKSFSKLLLLDKKIFRSYTDAAEYLNKDVRVIKKWEGVLYEIDRTITHPSIIFKICSGCLNQTQSRNCRNGYCKECSKKGIGRKNQAKIVSEKYKGNGNPNFIDGKALLRNNKRSKTEYKNWVKEVKKQCNNKCYLTGIKTNLEAHHILPMSIFPEVMYESWNGVMLVHHCHIELHRLRLDVELLPTLYYESKQDAQHLREVFVHQPQIQLLLQLPEKTYSWHERISVIPKNYHKLILDRHPEFAQSVLNLSESKSLNQPAGNSYT
jgi:hypothetical protein